ASRPARRCRAAGLVPRRAAVGLCPRIDRASRSNSALTITQSDPGSIGEAAALMRHVRHADTPDSRTTHNRHDAHEFIAPRMPIDLRYATQGMAMGEIDLSFRTLIRQRPRPLLQLAFPGHHIEPL